MKDKLLNSAIRVFSRTGYRDGKVAEIVRGAKANIASVNYYFGSKEKLFAQVLRKAYAKAEAVHPVSGNLPKSAPPEERLAAFARAIVRRTLDSGSAGDFNRIMSKTVHSPGSPIDTICAEITTLQVEPLQEILVGYLGQVDEQSYAVATLNFLSLAAVVAKHPFVIEKIFGDNPAPEKLEAFVEQQVAAILAATKSLASHQPSNAY
ncbi:TetR family transcriptional regulator [Rubritalea tangerina]|uniref:TetR family transcriptional regulator n=1 Tax=Rubritalea tangerina TaxID=430798 RepID=A0ABW4ZAW6_9BACT